MRQRGFTLIEVLLVVLLMGIAAAAVTLSLPGSGVKPVLDKAASQFLVATDLIRDEAVLSGQFLGVVVDEDNYQYVVLHEGKWHKLENDRLLAARNMEPGVRMSLVVEGLPLDQEEEDESWFDEPFIDEPTAEQKAKNPEPQILVFPSGEMTAFELTFLGRDDLGQEVDVLISGDALGRLKLGRGDDETP
ncbi:type II secretion system minor pseudopilin GspH [Shewanella litorisediminis]|uniref:Type II secretion system protein H n=1 Tax=Shewanella litorisediminis TaxID=1173586 RepID=A0ABX7G3Z0_9GAMM|nr:type II secretion system minor pseudopilin GspH [Shewanella litorisediminis]MCL2919370.1 type II secretion system minor pseudopilin GspH [Shewanella litorisediminis]QRH02014.1 type II secretion system minor pseudopilin GspH [Shewanella litorisediminis]